MRRRTRRLGFEHFEPRLPFAAAAICVNWNQSESAFSPHNKTISAAVVLVSTPTQSDSAAALPATKWVAIAGERLVAEIWVQERGTEPRGITGGQVDLQFPSSQLRPVGNINHGETFTLLPSGQIGAGLVDNLGGATLSPSAGANPAWARLGSVTFDVLANGPINVELSKGELEFAIFGQGNVPWSEVVFSTDISCVTSEINSDTFRITAGASLRPLDVLTNDSLSNGSGRTLALISASLGSQGGTISVAPDKTTLLYSPRSGFAGIETFTYAVGDGASTYTSNVRVDVFEPNPWQNSVNAHDVNGDGIITPLDALLVIIDLNTNGSRSLQPSDSKSLYVDVSGDRFVSPLDALLVIIALNGDES